VRLSRDAWLATIAAVLGTSELACKKDSSDGPAVAREVPSVTASASASVATAPSETASTEVVASASATASASAAPVGTGIGIGNIGTGNIGRIGHAACGVGRTNPSCGATVDIGGPVAVISTTVTGAASGDERVVAMMRPRLRGCANKGLAMDPTQTGKAVVTIAIGANGEVATSNVTSSTGLGASTVACMAAAFRSATFPAGAPRSVVVTIAQRIEQR